ncbi:bifunctional diguanylate cyclase/phosphodiesterase [Undibacterium fentianense]|uniref:EAL domain-containing protein n=1 Tax=Undibacterium fentianense TaxID=2828728 RepID=A0A941E1S2_9BURK|nr:EAL domain-containing protein [Undibacterium fentianense]MBR7799806.1 EAL domain-containing protein [Undibacterium fentianense]
MRARISLVMGMLWLLFGIALTLFLEMRFEASLQTAANESLDATADEIAHTLVKDLQDRQRELALLADLLREVQLTQTSAVDEVISNLKKRQPIYAWIGLAGADGRIMSGSDGLLLGADVSSRPWFKEGFNADYVSDPHDAKLLDHYFRRDQSDEPVRFVDVAVPVKVNQRVSAVLSAHLFWKWVHEVVSNTLEKRRKKTPIEVLIANREGNWLLKFQVAQTEAIGDIRAVTSNDQYLVATQRVLTDIPKEGLGWTVVVREHKRFALSVVEESRQMLYGISILMAVLFAGIAWIVSGRIAKPLIRLADAAKHFALIRSDTAHPIATKRLDETSVLDAAMDHLVHYDLLTGLCNRTELLASLQDAISEVSDGDVLCALVLINLDNFGVINSTRGHDVGDKLLIEIAKRLQSFEDDDMVISRLGGDEFIVLLKHLDVDRHNAELNVEKVAQQLMAILDAPIQFPTMAIECPASIGLTIIGDASISTDDALKFSELAVAEAKRRGRHQIVKFDRSLLDRLYAREQFKQDFVAGITSQLRVYYQMQVNQQGQVVGAEALVRWFHPERGMISPAIFIPLAEETGLIVPVGRFVMRTACEQLKLWESDPRRQHLSIAVNVCSHEFNEASYVQQVEAILRETGVRPEKLKLELTESALASDVELVVAKMRELQKFGLRFSLDDFGTGFSSLSYLRLMPLSQLKIDQSFVRDVTTNLNDASIVRTVIALGKSLGLNVIAEGVETSEQKQLLMEYGCDLYQGYFFGRPQAAEEFERAMDERTSNSI